MYNTLRILLLFTILTFPVKAQFFDFSAKDASKLAGRNLIVVIQEEDPRIIKLYRKSPEKLAAYKTYIAYTNSLLKKVTLLFWTKEDSIEFKTKSECIALSESSEKYFTLDFASMWQKDNTQLFRFSLDTVSIYTIRNQLIQRKEFGYFELKLIEKFRNNPFYTIQTPASIANGYDFSCAILFVNSLLEKKRTNNKHNTRDFEIAIQETNQFLAAKNLCVDSAIVNRMGKSYNYIAEEYDSASTYTLTDAKTLENLLFAKDSTVAILTVLPYIDPISRGQSYIGTSGGSLNEYENITYYMQLIFDPSKATLLYYDKSEESVIIVKDWRRFQRYSRDNSFKLPQLNNTPTQEKYYQQNQY